MTLLGSKNFDPEYMELLGIEYYQADGNSEIKLHLKCLILGWQFKRILTRIAKAIGLSAWAKDGCFAYLITVTFHDVVAMKETLLSQGHMIADLEPSSDSSLQGIIFDVEELGIRENGDDSFHLHLIAEGLTLECDFQHYSLEANCLDMECT